METATLSPIPTVACSSEERDVWSTVHVGLCVVHTNNASRLDEFNNYRSAGLNLLRGSQSRVFIG